LLWLAYVEGMSHEEIAAATGLRVLSIKILLFRARRKAAHLLAPPAAAQPSAPQKRFV
jgi:RNA polymerase sigma-70 factor (ECF subfamily)